MAATDTNLASAETNYQISDEGIFCFSRAVTHHHTPAIGLGKLAARRDKTDEASHSARLLSSLCPSDASKWHTFLTSAR